MASSLLANQNLEFWGGGQRQRWQLSVYLFKQEIAHGKLTQLGVRKASLGNFSSFNSQVFLPQKLCHTHTKSESIHLLLTSFDLQLLLFKTSPLFPKPLYSLLIWSLLLMFHICLDSIFLQKLTCFFVSSWHSVFSPVLLLSQYFMMAWLLLCIPDYILCFGTLGVRAATSTATAPL